MNFIKQYKSQFFVLLPILVLTFIGIYYFNERNIARAEERMGATSVNMPVQGGLGTSQIPTAGQIPVGQANGKYTPTSTITATTSFMQPVGIGTTNPLALLNISNLQNTSTEAVLRFSDENVGGGYFEMGTTNGSAGFAIKQGATQIMRIRSGGNVGFGTETTPDFRLEVSKSGTTDYFGMTSSTDGDVFIIKNSGNVGINRTAPDYPLEVDGNISIWDSANVAKGFRLVRNSSFLGGFNTDSSQASFFASAGNGLNFTVSSSVQVMRIFPNGNINIGNIASTPNAKLDIYSTVGSISSETDYAIRMRDVAGTIGLTMGVSATSGAAIFQSVDPGTSWTTKYIHFQPNGGKVSIGMASPTYAFEVGLPNRASQTTGDLSVDTTGNVVYVGKLDSSGGNSTFIMRDRLNNEKLKFFNGGSGSIFMGNMNNGFGVRIQGTAVGAYASTQTTTARLEVSSSVAGQPAANFLVGNVGIGTTTPIETLTVAGNIWATGYYTINSSTFMYDRPWKDENQAGVAMGQGATALSLVQVSSTNIYARCFNGGTTVDQMFWGSELQHDWFEGSTIKPHIHWFPEDANAGNVTWRLDYFIAKNSGSSPAELSGTLTKTVSTTGVAWLSTTTEFADITLPNNKIGTQIMWRIYRDPTGTDTYAGNSCLETAGYHYQVNSNGSRQVFTK